MSEPLIQYSVVLRIVRSQICGFNFQNFKGENAMSEPLIQYSVVPRIVSSQSLVGSIFKVWFGSRTLTQRITVLKHTTTGYACQAR